MQSPARFASALAEFTSSMKNNQRFPKGDDEASKTEAKSTKSTKLFVSTKFKYFKVSIIFGKEND